MINRARDFNFLLECENINVKTIVSSKVINQVNYHHKVQKPIIVSNRLTQCIIPSLFFSLFPFIPKSQLATHHLVSLTKTVMQFQIPVGLFNQWQQVEHRSSVYNPIINAYMKSSSTSWNDLLPDAISLFDVIFSATIKPL